jgi:hypothetical protein
VRAEIISFSLGRWETEPERRFKILISEKHYRANRSDDHGGRRRRFDPVLLSRAAEAFRVDCFLPMM